MNELRPSTARYWVNGVLVPVVGVAIVTTFCVWIGIRNHWDTAPLSLTLTALIGGYGCMVVTKHQKTLHKILIALCYFAGLLFFWFHTSLVSAALFGSKGNI